MARRPNYGFEKRQKELDRQKKKDAKAERKQAKREERARVGTDPDTPATPDIDPGAVPAVARPSQSGGA